MSPCNVPSSDILHTVNFCAKIDVGFPSRCFSVPVFVFFSFWTAWGTKRILAFLYSLDVFIGTVFWKRLITISLQRRFRLLVIKAPCRLFLLTRVVKPWSNILVFLLTWFVGRDWRARGRGNILLRAEGISSQWNSWPIILRWFLPSLWATSCFLFSLATQCVGQNCTEE